MNKEGVNGFPPESLDPDVGDPVLPSTELESQLSNLLHMGYDFDPLDIDGQPFSAFEESGLGDVCQQGSPCLPGYDGDELGRVDASQNFLDGNFANLTNNIYTYHQGVHDSGFHSFIHSGYEDSLAQGQATAGYTCSAREPFPDSVSPAQLVGGYSPSTTSLTWHQQSPISTTLASPPTPLSLSSPVFHSSTPVGNAFLTTEFTPSMSSLVLGMPNTPLVATTDAEVFSPVLGASESAVVADNHAMPVLVPEIHFHPSPDAQATPYQPGQEPDKRPCPLCHKMIHNKARDLKRHMDTHKNKESLACMICGTRCCRRDNLKRHMRDKHEEDLPALPRGPPKGSKRAPRRQAGNEGG